MIYEKHPAASSLLGHRILGLALGAHEEDDASLRGQLAYKAAGFAEHFQSLLQINDVNAITFPEDIFLHLGVPAAGLVAKVDSSLQQLFHRNFNCQRSSYFSRMLSASQIGRRGIL